MLELIGCSVNFLKNQVYYFRLVKKDPHIKQQLLERYLMGLCSEEENRTVEDLMTTDPEFASRLRASQQAIKNMAEEYDIPAKTLTTTRLPADNSPFNWQLVLLAIATLVLTTLLLISYQQQTQLRFRLANLQYHAEQIKKENHLLRQQLNQDAQQFALLTHHHTQPVHIKGLGKFPDLWLIAYWNPKAQKACLKVVNLPKLPGEKSLQLWADVAGEMINMGILETNSDSLYEIPFVPEAASLNLTVEERGGSDHPDVSKLYAVGKL